MSASGKSSAGLSEYNRGYHTRSGHGPYAAAGMEDRERHDEFAAREASGRPENPPPERHQEGQLRDDPCGCQLIWSRGRWHPSVTCREHYDDGEAW